MKTGLCQRLLASTPAARREKQSSHKPCIARCVWSLKSLNVPEIRVKRATKMWPIRAVWPVRQPIRTGYAWTKANHIKAQCSCGHRGVGEGPLACSRRKQKCERDAGQKWVWRRRCWGGENKLCLYKIATRTESHDWDNEQYTTHTFTLVYKNSSISIWK